MSADSPLTSELSITTSDDVELEAQLVQPAPARIALVVAHPHPQFGGDMYNNVVTALWRGAPAVGAAVLRFNFRGVGASTGRHGTGPGERRDLIAAVDALAHAVPAVPLVVAGYSFGAEVALSVDHSGAGAWFCVAPVFRMFPEDEVVAARDRRPKRLVVAEHDQYAPPGVAQEATRGWVDTTIDVAPMCDHFFGAGTRSVVESFTALASELTAGR